VNARPTSKQSRDGDPEPIAVRIPQAAKMIGIGRSKLYELIGKGEIETVKLGSATLVAVKSLHALMERHKRRGPWAQLSAKDTAP
jgi:excisionase family DNA binding protein